MKPHRTLFAKVLFWFFTNLVVVAVVLFGFFHLQFRVDPQSLLTGGADRVQTLGLVLARELMATPREKWTAVLESYSSLYNADFVLLGWDGQMVAGKSITVPPEVRQRAAAMPRGGGRGMHQGGMGGGMGRGAAVVHPPPPWPGHGRFTLHTTNPTRYWVGVRVPVICDQVCPPWAVLVVASDSITGHGLFFDPTPWILVALAVILISVVLWVPLVRSITRPIHYMTQATGRIARGRFDTRLDEGRADEIGMLGKSINDMTARLGGYVTGQKRFLGDVAHELASPIARLQLGLGILEQRVDDANRERVQDVIREVEHMSNLVNELLSFSRAELSPANVKLTRVVIAPIVQRVLERERRDGAEIKVAIDDQLAVLGDPELLARALANLVRNAVRYAGEAGPIEIVAERRESEVAIAVRDAGPGVPPDVLPHLFEPFFRLEPARGRDSGGVGLGLAIVRTCVEACHGSVSAANLTPQGFAVTMIWPAGD